MVDVALPEWYECSSASFMNISLIQERQTLFSSRIQSDHTGSIICGTFVRSLLFIAILTFKLQSFDGVRQRCLPRFYKALEPGTEDDRMKGALWTLNVPVFGMPSIYLA